MKSSSTVSDIKSDQHYASPGLPRIFAAMGYDFLLLAAISIAYGAIVVGIHIVFAGQPEQGQRIQWSTFSSIVISIGWLLVLMTFFIYFWHKFGQTLGMKTWRLQVLKADILELPTFRQCCIRSLAAIFSLAAFGVGYWWKFFNPQQKMLHDVISGTRLVLLKKK